jgi:P-type Na+/K+ transporter
VFEILLRQISNSLTFVLFAVMILSFALGDYIEAAVVTAVVLVNVVVGFVQDFRAEKSVLSLQALSSPECNVIRSSKIQTIRAENLVVGDIVQLATGDIVPADLRLFESLNLSTDEALLTGESMPVSKNADITLPWSKIDTAIGDRSNMVYSASVVTRGRGMGLVTATALRTEVGKIAALLENKKKSKAGESKIMIMLKRARDGIKSTLGLTGSPLSVSLSKFALLLFALAILLALVVFAVSLFDISDEVLIYGICVAIAIIPESLIAVLTLTIAIGTQAMAKNNIIVRRLQSLEAVGGVTNICSDKTGTLTLGKMVVKRAQLADGGLIRVHDTSDPFNPHSGSIEATMPTQSEKRSENLTKMLEIASLCNLAEVTSDSPTNGSVTTLPAESKWAAVGEPTEIALQVFAMRFSHGKSEALVQSGRQLLQEFPFDSAIKRMAVAYTGSNESVDVFVKGATEALLPLLNSAESKKQQILQDAEAMALKGLRVLCLATKSVPSTVDLTERSSVESDLEFIGLVGIYDPPRSETAEAVRTCQSAGIKVHMLTGDHIGTASAIAAEVGIIKKIDAGNGIVMAASDFDKLTTDQIDALPELPLVIARCSPTTKVRMVQALHRRQAFCIMTGDGINDSPALKLADIGIAMGINGSDVAKQAADMVLADDNFASIVRAIKEGRRLFDNIQKFLLHLLTSNIAQVVLLMVGLVFQDSEGHSIFPMSPLEILWVNLVTSAPIALGLGLEPAVPDIMDRPPHPLRIGVFTWELIADKMVYGCGIGGLCLSAFAIVVYGAGAGNLGQDCNEGFNDTCNVVFRARSTVFGVLTFALLILAWEVIDFRTSLFNTRLHSRTYDTNSKKVFSVFPTIYQNRFLFWSCVAGFVIIFPLIYIPGLNVDVFDHRPISWEWGIVMGCIVIQILIIEFWKWGKRGKLGSLLTQKGMVDRNAASARATTEAV